MWHNTTNVLSSKCYFFRLHFMQIFTQLYIPLAMRFAYFDFFRLKSDHTFILVCLGIAGTLQLFMLFQKVIGRSFYLPNSLVPGYYNYYKKVGKLEQQDEKCSICFNELKKQHDEDDADTLDKKLLSKHYMETPCQHKFHTECLKPWMD